MKKFLIGLLILLMALSIAGCGAKEKAAKKTAEKILKDAGVEADIEKDAGFSIAVAQAEPEED